jgi:hypothetical protein
MPAREDAPTGQLPDRLHSLRDALAVAGREAGNWGAFRALLPERQVKAQYQVSGVGERSREVD